MSEFKRYRRKANPAELRPYVPGMEMVAVERDERGFATTRAISISEKDLRDGSPKEGDWIARNPLSHLDQWLIAAKYFQENFEPEPID